MNGFEATFFWSTAVLLAASLFSALLGLVFRRQGAMRLSGALLILATVALTVMGVSRWVRSGHPPFVSIFESMITSIWFLLVIHLIVRWRAPKLAITSFPVAVIVLLMLGWAAALPDEVSALSAALTNVWLFIHASFATSAAATFLIAASLAVIYLLGEERLERLRDRMNALPTRSAIPRSMTNFLLFGLILWGVMIASGSVWAHSAWGRYWAWDPIELWSLISWLVYALLFHARLTLKLSPKVFSILTIAAALTVVFSLWGVQYVYHTIHTYG